MKIGIHKSSGGFSEHWINYCIQEKIPYKLINSYGSDVIEQMKDCSAFMWHFYHFSPKDFLFARQLLYACESSGIKIFPHFRTMWHFDDKIGQKYLLESIGAPVVPTFVFYTKKEAINWINQTEFPKVFKLRGGASSANVSLVNSKSEALILVNKAFGNGFKQTNAYTGLKERLRKYRLGKTDFKDVLKGFGRFFIPTEFSKVAGKEVGYIYFQDFIPQNDSDFRVIVIGNKAFAIKRMVRKGDFRASGSGHILYDKNLFDISLIKLSFEVNKKLNAQCVAFDFVFHNKKPLIVEISYGFSPSGYIDCPGYWDENLNWFEGKFNPYGWMVELVK
jgi:glutathione synthase/RimK-type ligase-like ATP-grasp enzyme